MKIMKLLLSILILVVLIEQTKAQSLQQQLYNASVELQQINQQYHGYQMVYVYRHCFTGTAPDSIAYPQAAWLKSSVRKDSTYKGLPAKYYGMYYPATKLDAIHDSALFSHDSNVIKSSYSPMGF